MLLEPIVELLEVVPEIFGVLGQALGGLATG